MGLVDWLAAVLRGMGWKVWVFVTVFAVLGLTLPGVWAVRSFMDGGTVVGDASLSGERERVVVDGRAYRVPDLTREAVVLREASSHDATLIASIPTPTATVRPGATRVTGGGLDVVALLAENPGGVPLLRNEGPLDWFDPEQGLFFYRVRGGDWTDPGVRERSPYRSLVEYRNYPDGVSNFADGSIVYDLAVKLAFGMAEVRPAFGRPTPAMVAALSRDLGWEMVDVEDEPAFRLWTRFTFRAADRAEYEYAVGGVMVMQVGELESGAQYLIPGNFVEPGVVLQRLDVER